ELGNSHPVVPLYARGPTLKPKGNFSATARIESLIYWLPRVLDKMKAPVEGQGSLLQGQGSLLQGHDCLLQDQGSFCRSGARSCPQGSLLQVQGSLLEGQGSATFSPPPTCFLSAPESYSMCFTSKYFHFHHQTGCNEFMMCKAVGLRNCMEDWGKDQRKTTLSDTSSQTPKPRKMDNSKAAEDNPPSQDTLATSEAPFPTPKNSDTHQGAT
ncbi:hypothetical protein A6R68_13315, partial [Neotoma lepida]